MCLILDFLFLIFEHFNSYIRRLLPALDEGSYSSAGLVRALREASGQAPRFVLPSSLRSSLRMWPDWVSLVLATFAETKVARRSGAKPGKIQIATSSALGGDKVKMEMDSCQRLAGMTRMESCRNDFGKSSSS